MNTQGLSLIEMLTVVGIITLSVAIALPSFKNILTSKEINSEFIQLHRALTIARDQAIRQNQSIIICPSVDQLHCDGQWHDGFISFVDSNRNHDLDSGEQLISAKSSFRAGDVIYWRAFRRRNFLEMSPLGYTAFQNGTFTYCPKEGLAYAKGLILNTQGRLRFTSDEDGDGIDEGADNQPLRCE